MVQRALEKEDGYTIVEILVALTLVSIVIGIVGSVFIFVSRQMNRWEEAMSLNNDYQLAQHRLFMDLLQADGFTLSDSVLIVSHGEKPGIEYTLDDARLTRNSAMFTNNTDTLILSIGDDFTTNSLKTWSLIQKSDGRKFETSFYLSSRKPTLWEPLNTRGNN